MTARRAPLTLGTVFLRQYDRIMAIAASAVDREVLDLSREVKLFCAGGLHRYLLRDKEFRAVWDAYRTSTCPSDRVPTDWALEQDLDVFAHACRVYTKNRLLQPIMEPMDGDDEEVDDFEVTT